MGEIGDIGVETSHTQEVVDILNQSTGRLIKQSKLYENHHVYYKTENGWKLADKRRHENGKPYTAYPKIGILFFLDNFSFTWRSARNYYRKRSRSNQLDSPSGKRDEEVELSVVGGELKPKKRARMDSEPALDPPPCDNSWIMKECCRWESPPIIFATHRTLYNQGRRILQKLAAVLSKSELLVPAWPHGPELKHISIIHAHTDHLKAKPERSHVVRDFFLAGENGDHMSIVNLVYDGPANHNSVETVISSFISSGDRADPVEEVTPIGALTIPASHSGLGKVDLLPNQVKDSTEVVYEQRKPKKKKLNNGLLTPSWASCLMPTGAITGPHTDYCGCSQLIQHIQGRKLWLCWPPTPHNLNIYFRDHLSGNIPLSTEDAIDQLERMELLLLDHEQTCFILPGGTIHAVLTFTTSCHAGLKLWCIGDFEAAERMNKIQSEMMVRRENWDEGTVRFYEQYFVDLKGELEKWDELRNKNKSGKFNEEIRQWIKSWTAEKLNVLLRT